MWDYLYWYRINYINRMVEFIIPKPYEEQTEDILLYSIYKQETLGL